MAPGKGKSIIKPSSEGNSKVTSAFHGNNVKTKSSELSANWKAFLASRPPDKPKFSHRRKHKPVDGKASDKEFQVKKEVKKEIWFDDVDPDLIHRTCASSHSATHMALNRRNSSFPVESHVKNCDDVCSADPAKLAEITKHVGLDCEMVGVGIKGKESILARASLVNSRGECVYDSFVKPSEDVADYRTEFSGVRAADVKNAPDFKTVQKEISDILLNRILVGHALHNDLDTLMLSHPRKQIRDTQKYKPFQKLMQTKRPALRKLAKKVLNITIQDGEHSSVVDARTAMSLYILRKKEWEKSLRSKKSNKTKVKGAAEVYTGANKKIDKRSNRKEKLARMKKKRNQAESK